MKRFWFRKVAGFIVLAIAGAFIFGEVVMLLWNALLPVLFHFPIISFWQALGLLLLTKILFGGFRGGGPRGRWKEKMQDKMKQKWTNMTPEQREKFKQEWGRRCGKTPFDREGMAWGNPPSQENPGSQQKVQS